MVPDYSLRNVWCVIEVCAQTQSSRSLPVLFLCISPTASGAFRAAHWISMGCGCGLWALRCSAQIEIWCVAEVVFATQCHHSGVLSL